jgi:carbonic anhydrase
MSCPNSTAPININTTPYAMCELKCDYKFGYPDSPTLVLTNNDAYLSIQFDQTGNAPVVYNDSKYQIHEIRLYPISLHTYGGQNASAELIIHHSNVQGGNDLIVCIPIMNDNSPKGESSELFRMIMSEVANQANSQNRETVANIDSFSLNKFIPMFPYYSYSASLLYTPCGGAYDYIVFSINNGGFMTMDNDTYALFTQVITPTNTYSVNPISDSSVFYNATGPTSIASSSNSNDEIFIDCQPTGANGESLVPVYKSLEPALANNIGDVLNNKFVKMVAPALIIFIVVKFVGSILNSMTNVGKQSGGGGGGGGSGSGIGKRR